VEAVRRLLLVGTLGLAPSGPYIKSRLGGVYTIQNPLRVQVQVTLDCGPAWETPPVPVRARDTTVVAVQDGSGVAADCAIGSWRRSR
jgi:hypothetical protein